MSTIAVLVRSARLAEELSLASSTCGSIRSCADPAALRAALMDGADLAFIELHDGNARILPAIVRELRAVRPGAAILVYCSPGLSVSSAILSVARAGANSLLLRGFDELEPSLRAALRVASPASAVAWVVRSVAPLVPSEMADVMQCVENDPRLSPSVDQLCRMLRTNRRTLSYRFRRANYPPPHTVIAWTRVLAAARLLEQTHASVEGVAASLGFRSGTAMRTLFVRLTGMTPSVARAPGGYERLLASFVEASAVRRPVG